MGVARFSATGVASAASANEAAKYSSGENFMAAVLDAYARWMREIDGANGSQGQWSCGDSYIDIYTLCMPTRLCSCAIPALPPVADTEKYNPAWGKRHLSPTHLPGYLFLGRIHAWSG